jgi:hypothetical protein
VQRGGIALADHQLFVTPEVADAGGNDDCKGFRHGHFG